jgi:hypothetical protein
MYKINFQEPIHIHFIGIGGISMSGLAEILFEEHFTISGSDSKESELTRHLEHMGMQIFYGQKASNIIEGIDLIVYTAAIREDNPEFAAAKEKGIPMLSRAELLGQIMDNYQNSIAVSGTHGKTTTTSMISQILLAAKKDPTITVGGILKAIDGNLRVGKSDVFISEACEYTNSFLNFRPKYSIILNIEAEHLDFFKDIHDIRNSFHLFAQNTKENGAIIINGEIDVIRKEMIAMLLAGGQGSRLGVLTSKVAKPAVAFGGKYRIIDFPLSNCINSGIDTVGVLTQYQPLRLNTHIGIGIPWDLDRNNGGVTVLPPYEKSNNSEWYSGTANAIYQNMNYMEQYNPEYVLILSGDHIYKMDYEVMLDFHKENNADVTIATMPVPLEEASRFGIVIADEDKRIQDFEEKPVHRICCATVPPAVIHCYSWVEYI